jgi:hypothetical protein
MGASERPVELDALTFLSTFSCRRVVPPPDA